MAGEFGRLRWSGAVREAFLRGLAAHGSVRRACRETGMCTAGAYDLRRRDRDFEKLWLKAVARAGEARAAALGAAGQKRQQRSDGMFPGYRHRHDGWTEARARVFLRALAETGCVRDACTRARISNVSAYRMRRRHAKFAKAWEKALDAAIPTLEQAAWERAVEGWDEVVWKDGVEVSRRRRFSDGLLRFLLDRAGAGRPGRNATEKELIAFAKEAARAAGGFFATPATSAETDAAILKKLAMMDKLRARQAADAAARAAQDDEYDDEDWDADGEDAGDVPPPPVPPRGMLPRITGG